MDGTVGWSLHAVLYSLTHGLDEMASAAIDGLEYGNVWLTVGQVVGKQRIVLVAREKPVRGPDHGGGVWASLTPWFALTSNRSTVICPGI